MYDLNKADQFYERRLDKDPNYTRKMVEKFREEMPEEYSKFMYRQEYGNHIGDRSMYDDAVRRLRWANNKGSGAKWDVDELASKSGIDFDEEGYSKYDYGMAVNELYADYNNIFTEPSYYMKMARNYLTSRNYPYRPQERAYREAENRNRRYDYNNRNNTYDYSNRGNQYNYESRRGGSRQDRDNDGRYNEGR